MRTQHSWVTHSNKAMALDGFCSFVANLALAARIHHQAAIFLFRNLEKKWPNFGLQKIWKKTKWSPRTRMLTRLLAILITFSTGHSCGTPWHDTLIWQSGRTLLLDTIAHIAQHSRETILLDTLIRHSDLTLLWGTLTWHSCGALLLDTVLGHSYLTRFLDALTWHFCKTL